jgi:hypothetical protein
VIHESHPERHGPASNRLANPTRTDDAERRPTQFEPKQLLRVPTHPPTISNECLTFLGPPRHRQDQEPGEIRGGIGEHVGRVGDHHPMPACGLEIDVVVSNRAVGHDPEVRKGGELRIAKPTREQRDRGDVGTLWRRCRGGDPLDRVPGHRVGRQ